MHSGSTALETSGKNAFEVHPDAKIAFFQGSSPEIDNSLGVARIRKSMKSYPDITILIPTKDRLELLINCLSTLSEQRYPGSVQVVVMDNQSRLPETVTFLDEWAAKTGMPELFRVEGEFNFSRINNIGANAAHGEYIFLCNNDIVFTDEFCLKELVEYASELDVGACGAFLEYP